MPAGPSPKREHEYKKLQQRFKHEHRYPGREEEVASRIVNKQRSQYGETKAEQEKDRKGLSPDRNLPLKDYQHMTIAQIASQLQDLPASDIKKIRAYEIKHKNRKGLLARLDRLIGG